MLALISAFVWTVFTFVFGASIFLRKPVVFYLVKWVIPAEILENPFGKAAILWVSYQTTGVWFSIFALNILVSYLCFPLLSLVIAVSTILFGVVFSFLYPTYYQRKGLEASRKLLRIEDFPSEIVEEKVPQKHVIPNVPYRSIPPKGACVTTCLQMILAYFGKEYDSTYLNGVTGWFFGYTYLPPIKFAGAITEPHSGLLFASPFLGMTGKFYSSDSWNEYKQAMKYYISKKMPILLPIDAAVLYKEEIIEGWAPHGVVLVGYDEEDRKAYYWEPNEIFFEKYGRKYIPVDMEKIKAALEGFGGVGGLAMRTYNMMIFEPGEGEEKNVKEVLKRNGELLIGQKGAPFAFTGSYGIRKFAKEIGRGFGIKDATILSKKLLSMVPYVLDPGVYTREEAANFVLNVSEDISARKAAELLKKSSELFTECSEEMKSAIQESQSGVYPKERLSKMKSIMMRIAIIEQEAGTILMRQDI